MWLVQAKFLRKLQYELTDITDILSARDAPQPSNA